VILTSPTEGATVNGTVAITAAAERAESVRFEVDGTEVASDTEAPYTTQWNSVSVTDGSHTVRAVAEGGGKTASDAIPIMVQNTAGTVTVTISPATAGVETGKTRQFTATLTGSANTAVT
jgi:hypothetical protein